MGDPCIEFPGCVQSNAGIYIRAFGSHASIVSRPSYPSRCRIAVVCGTMTDVVAKTADVLLTAMDTEEPFRLLRTLPGRLQELCAFEGQRANSEVREPTPSLLFGFSAGLRRALWRKWLMPSRRIAIQSVLVCPTPVQWVSPTHQFGLSNVPNPRLEETNKSSLGCSCTAFSTGGGFAAGFAGETSQCKRFNSAYE